MPYVKCRNCGFVTRQASPGAPIEACPECCGRLRLDGGFRLADTGPFHMSGRFAVTKWAPTHARHAIADIREQIGDGAAPDVELLVTELVTNAVSNANSRLPGVIALAVSVGEEGWRIEVSDDGPGFSAAARREDQDSISGWGLFLVENLADRWGVERAGGRTLVWLEIDRSSSIAPWQRDAAIAPRA